MISILVTGGAGYIGSHTCKTLQRAGFVPVTFDNLARGNPEAVKWGPLEVGDLIDAARLRETIMRYRPAAVIHFAALAYVGESSENPTAYYRNNVGGTATLLHTMRECGIDKIVFSSTCAVYGTPYTVPIPEQHRCVPINPYGATKMICERMLGECSATSSLRYIALRYFNAAGADPEGDVGECHVPETHVIPLLLDAAAGESDSFTIYGDDYPTPDGTCVRDYIHVGDLADAHVKAVQSLLAGAESTALNLGTGRGWSVRELIGAVRQITGRDVPVQVGQRRSGDAPALVADSELARRQLSWRPQHSDLATMISHAWTWRQGPVQEWKRVRMLAAQAALG